MDLNKKQTTLEKTEIERASIDVPNKEMMEVERSPTDQLCQTIYIEDLLQDPIPEERKERKEHTLPVVDIEKQSLERRRPGPKSFKGRTAESHSRESSAMDTETYEISSSDSDVPDYGRNRRRRAVIEEDSDVSPPEKVNIGNSGIQRTTGNRKRERMVSDVDSDNRRSRTTGDYVGRREAIQRYNEAKEESLQLDREKLIREYSSFELFKKAKVDIDKIKEKMEGNSLEELQEKVSENMTEVMRIARCSSNLKGTFQKSLKIAASTSMGIFDIMKERAKLSKEDSKSEEVRALKREIAKLKHKLEEGLESEKRKALQAKGEAEAYKSELQALKKAKERQEKKDKTPSPKEKDKERNNRGKSASDTTKKSPRRIPSDKIKERDKLMTSESEYMDVDEKTSRTKKVILDNPEKWPEAIKKKLTTDQLVRKERQGPKSRRSETDVDTHNLADMIRRIVAEELSKANRKSVITDIQTLKTPVRLEKGKSKDMDRKYTKVENKGTKANSKETSSKNTEKEKTRTTLEEEIDREEKEKELPWSRVVGRKEKHAASAGKKIGAKKTLSFTPTKTPKASRAEGDKDSRRVPKTAAIQISCRGEASYTEVMRTAREKVDIDAMGIHDLRPRKSRTEALLLEIPGAENSIKADKLAEKLQQALEGQRDVLVSRLEKMADIRMKDLEESTTKEDILLALTLHGNCSDKTIGWACKPPVIKGKSKKEPRASGRELSQDPTKNKENLGMEVEDNPQTQSRTEERKEREASVIRQLAKCSVKEGAKSEDTRIMEEMEVEEIRIESIPGNQTSQVATEWPELGQEWTMTTQDAPRKEGNGEGGLQHKEQNDDQ
ncbi:PREDICTED: calponin homology domain-containing protein DDB_G0272472-like [Trachymyrmex cornetzi]|uniref:calponin homology domain-containing protein DDB_G0272472-like n=1 Tax=Trachymyrmex cornetzi TaxID=471704 RepID=UPI00084F1442|nr:PREDICTED: calponin homology domain-containing protein DDB_G0272472-like [Trachymyrmex cornetzi]